MFGSKPAVKKTDTAIGIDIGSFAVKAVQLVQKKDEFQLESFGYSKINNEKLSGIPDAIRTAYADAKLSGKRVNVAVGADGVVVRYIVLPEMSGDDLAKAMEFEIERYVPFEKQDIVSDYLVLKGKADSKTIKVLLVAAKKEQVDRRVKLLKEVGLEVEVMTIDSIVLKSVFQSNYLEKNDKTVGLLNIGSKVSNINIIKSGVSYFMRDVQLGGDNITQLLKEKLDVDIHEAEKLKCRLTLEDRDKFKIIEPILGNLLNEVYLSFDYYESEFGMVVDEIFISGGGAQLAWLPIFLKENLNREITTLNSVNKLTLNPSIVKQDLNILSSSMAVSIGLALESFV